MSEWEFEEFGGDQKKVSKDQSSNQWDIMMTIVTFFAVTIVSFLITWLTKDIPSRPFWMLGLCFAAPVTALLLSAFIKEKVSSSMTPSTSRKAQLGLVCCSILVAFIVGCFCQVTNEKADTYEQVVVGDGWSDLLIILDKSGSMQVESTSENSTLNDLATRAVTELINQMDDYTQVGLLIDVGWEENNAPEYVIPLAERLIPIAALTPEHRKELTELAQCYTCINENFPMAFQVACEMVDQYEGQDGELSIVIISDGEDCTDAFRADDFSERLNNRGVKVYYLYVAARYSTEMKLLSDQTGGESIFVNNFSALLEQMKKMAAVPIVEIVYKDALRDINESDTAKLVTGILLGLLGVLIGVSLTVMFSLQGQKRFQMVLSPVMALLAFAILAFGKEVIPVPWIREGTAFSLLGIVLMRKNKDYDHKNNSMTASATVGTLEESSDNEW